MESHSNFCHDPPGFVPFLLNFNQTFSQAIDHSLIFIFLLPTGISDHRGQDARRLSSWTDSENLQIERLAIQVGNGRMYAQNFLLAAEGQNLAKGTHSAEGRWRAELGRRVKVSDWPFEKADICRSACSVVEGILDVDVIRCIDFRPTTELVFGVIDKFDDDRKKTVSPRCRSVIASPKGKKTEKWVDRQ
jgi:hypothetical protein